MKIEQKVCFEGKLEIKDDGAGPGTISGYFATFGNKDRQGDILVKGAFAEDLEDFIKDGVILARHGNETAQPIASISKAYEDDHGLFGEATFHSTQLAQEEKTIAKERMARGKSVAFSIGYSVNQGGAEYTKEGRMLKSVKTWETSLVNIPANPMALAAGVKELDMKKGVKGLFEEALDDRTNQPWNLWDTFMCVYYNIRQQDEASEALGVSYDFAGAITEACDELNARLKASIIEADREEDAAEGEGAGAGDMLGDMAMMGLGLRLADGRGYGDHLTAVANAAKGLLRRTEARRELRTKEGRMLSSNNESMLSDLADSLDVHAGNIRKLLDSNAKEPKNRTFDEGEMERKRRLVETALRMSGTLVN